MVPSSPSQAVCFGETLWDILPDNFLPGGAPTNVAYHLKKLGLQPALITKIGTDVLGSRLVGLLQGNGITTEFVQVDDKYSTGKVYAQVGEGEEVSYEIAYPAAWDFIRWEDMFMGLLMQADYFVYGTLSARSPASRDTLYQLLEGAKTKVLDVNLRAPHFQRPLVEHLMQKADILKMNKDEFDLITGWFHRFQRVEDNMKLLQERFTIEKVIVSLDREGAVMLDKEVIIRHPGYRVRVEDTIGCGDAFLAGLLYKFMKGAEPFDVLNYANSLGALIATYPGACPDYDAEEIDTLRSSFFKK